MTHKQWFNNVLHLHPVHEEGAGNSSTRIKVRIFECHAGMKCDLKVTKHCCCIWLSLDWKYKSYLTRKPLRLNPLQASCIPGVRQISILVP